MSRAEMIVSAARSVVGVKFRHQGRNPESGLDCAGVAAYCAKAAGIEHYDESDYPRLPGGGRLESALDKQAELFRIKVSEIMPGDILLMTFTGQPQHIAVVSDAGIIHAYETVGKVVEHRIDSIWRKRIVRAYRFREVEA